MNKQELIKNIRKLFVYGQDLIEIDEVLNLVNKLDEPGKVTIPQFVADVIEGAREQSPELEDALHYTWGNGTKEFTEWYNKKSNRDLFARAWLDGYELEEKRYLVTIKGIVSNFMVLKHNINEDTWYMSNKINYTDLKAYHTKKELEDAGFGWVFDCEGIEVEEVGD